MSEPDRLSSVLGGVAGAKAAERWRLFGLECGERRRQLVEGDRDVVGIWIG